MKRIFAAALALVLLLSSTLSAYADDSPLAAGDRVTEQLVAIQKRKADIEKTIAQREAAKNAAIFSGKNMSNKDDFSYFLNRKILTKKDFEAFKWSFIFSQFAFPLEDSLLDVFSQENFQKMINENFTITSVKEFLEIGDKDNPKVSADTGPAMLQNTNVPELVETIKENYAVYPIFYEDGATKPTLHDILNPGKLSLFETFYVYDTLAADYVSINGEKKDKQVSNSIFYNQELLNEDKMFSAPEIKSTPIPVFVYDANTYLYLQIAIGAYCKAQGQENLNQLSEKLGANSLCIDSFGNICVYDNLNSSAKILLPNFGNTFLNAREDEADLTEAINLYNKWFVTLYTRATRDVNKIYPDTLVVDCIDSLITEKTEDGISNYIGNGIPKSHYAGYIQKMDNKDMSNSLLLVETSDCISYPSEIFRTISLYNKLASATSHHISSNLKRVQFSKFTGRGKEGDFLDYMNQMYQAVKERPDVAITEDSDTDENGKAWHDTIGILRSAYNRHTKFYAPFVMSEESQEFYVNHYPIVAMNVSTDVTDVKRDENDNAIVYTHFARIHNSLGQGKWNIHGAQYFSSPFDTKVNSPNVDMITEELITLVTSFGSELILDNRFASWYNCTVKGIYNTNVYLPKSIIDVGQSMKAYTGDEKGMFLADYNLRFTGLYARFLDHVINATYLLEQNLGSVEGADFVDSTNDMDNFGDICRDKDAQTVTIYMWNDTDGDKADPAQRQFVCPWVFDYSNLGSQAQLEYFYKFRNSMYPDDAKGETEKCLKGTLTKHDIYTVSGKDITPHRIDVPYVDGTIDNTVEGCPGISNGVDEYNAILGGKTEETCTFDFTYYEYEYEGHTSPNFSTNSINFDKESVADIEDAIEKCTRQPFLSDDDLTRIYIFDMARAICNAMWYWAHHDGDSRGMTFTDMLNEMHTIFGIDPNVLGNSYLNLFTYNANDQNTDNRKNGYFYDEYLYFLRNPTYLSSAFGCNTSNDFSTVTYFWDRHYLQQAAFNKQVLNEVNDNWVKGSENAIASMDTLFSDYVKYLQERFLDPSSNTFQEYIEQDTNRTHFLELTNSTNTKLYSPYCYEYGLQEFNQTLLEYIKSEYSAPIKKEDSTTQDATTSSENKETDKEKEEKEEKEEPEEGEKKPEVVNTIDESEWRKTFIGSLIFDCSEWLKKNPNSESIIEPIVQSVGGGNVIYNYISDDTIILYPFSRLAKDASSYKCKVYAGLGDGVIKYAKSTEGLRAGGNGQQYARTDPVTLIMALQCNTDYERNNLQVAFAKAPQQQHVSKEELMDNANQFFTNPVSSLSFIITGFLYQVHATIATGNIGNVFSLNWLLESDVYKWVMDRYIAILAIAVAVILLLKLIQFAMNKSRDAASIGRSVVGILAMCLVPVVIFNSFVWAFDASSRWFLHGSLDKILLSQIDTKERERINSDAGVTAELSAFKEQFEALGLEGYECVTYEEMTGYSLENGPIYKHVGIWDYMDRVFYSTAYADNWYSAEKFLPIHSSRYNESIFYYFYDYIRAEYLNYCTTIGSGGNTVSVANIMDSIEQAKSRYASATTGDEKQDAVNDINIQEQTFAMLKSGFRTMLEDTTYVYGDTLLDANKHTTNGPKPKDLVGMYLVFNKPTSGNLAELDGIYSSPYYKAWENSDLMVATDDIVPKTWMNQDQLTEYFSDPGRARGKGGDDYYIITSYHDLFNKSYNNMDMAGLTINDVTITPLEEKLCALTDDIYNTTLQALNYLPDQIHDESAITLMAMIATCKLNEAFGVAPSEPILESVTLDSFTRTAFLTKLEDVGSNVNTLYAMVTQGDSIGKILVVVFLELIICVASVARMLIILYITGASFVILGLRLLHKAPSTTDLVYGIVGNMAALLALHAITLFLVIIAVEAVAGAVSVVPSLLLDILMIVFTFMMARMLYRLVKNIAKDAINIGGAKIKGMVHAVGDTILKAVHARTHADLAETEAQDVDINANEVNQTLEEKEETRVRRRRSHVAAIVDNIKQVENEEAELEEEQKREEQEAQQDHRVERNVKAERELSNNET